MPRRRRQDPVSHVAGTSEASLMFYHLHLCKIYTSQNGQGNKFSLLIPMRVSRLFFVALIFNNTIIGSHTPSTGDLTMQHNQRDYLSMDNRPETSISLILYNSLYVSKFYYLQILFYLLDV